MEVVVTSSSSSSCPRAGVCALHSGRVGVGAPSLRFGRAEDPPAFGEVGALRFWRGEVNQAHRGPCHIENGLLMMESCERP